MKKSWVSRFAGLVLVLTLISSSLVAGTYAKYATEVEATDSVTVAKWQADLEGVGTTTTAAVTFDLTETMSDTGVDGKLLAPGTLGSFSLDYDTDDSQVARNVTITLDASEPLAALTYLKFYSDASRTTEIVPAAGVLSLMNENFGPTAAGSGTLNIYWAWAFSADAAQDTADTVDGIAGLSYDVTATFTATQLDTI